MFVQCIVYCVQCTDCTPFPPVAEICARLAVSTSQHSSVGQIVWFGCLSAISQLASRVGEGGGVRQLFLHSVTQPFTTWPRWRERGGGLCSLPLGTLQLRGQTCTPLISTLSLHVLCGYTVLYSILGLKRNSFFHFSRKYERNFVYFGEFFSFSRKSSESCHFHEQSCGVRSS